MTDTKRYDHNQICTDDGEVKIGSQYQYKEDSHISIVKVLADNSTDDWLSFKLQIVEHLYGPEIGPPGYEFEVGAASGHYAYNGMWRLWRDGEYIVRKAQP